MLNRWQILSYCLQNSQSIWSLDIFPLLHYVLSTHITQKWHYEPPFWTHHWECLVPISTLPDFDSLTPTACVFSGIPRLAISHANSFQGSRWQHPYSEKAQGYLLLMKSQAVKYKATSSPCVDGKEYITLFWALLYNLTHTRTHSCTWEEKNLHERTANHVKTEQFML